ncbi:MAG: hypothetical protein L6R40_008504 [Gallowayella cf. fulva]|nr:MAG: hypothetical protein L6R40_008504 [Xanthomendoza cf. fulva]
MGRTTFLKFTAICLISTLIPRSIALSAAANGAQAFGLVSRQTSTCTASGYSPCNKPGIPSDFCCPSGTTCTAFNNNKSVICCPNGRDCKTISPLTCDLNAQNATIHPSNQLHSTDLTGTLQTCGTNTCCPKGFSCSNGNCVMQAAASSSAKPSSTAPATSTSKPTSTSASTTSKPNSTSGKPAGAAQTSAETTTSSEKHQNDFPVAAVLAGFFPGMLLGALLTVAMIICIGRRRAKREEKDGDFGSVAATVSDPIYQDSNGFRTDFLRRESKTKYSNRSSRVRSLFSRSPTLKSNNSDGYGRNILPKTPPNRTRVPELKKEPSMESIKIYSPPNGGLQRPTTTFTEMMADAGLKDGERYVGSPGRIDPRTRGLH